MIRSLFFVVACVLLTDVSFSQQIETYARSRFMIDDLAFDPSTGDLYGSNRSHRVTRMNMLGAEEAFALGFQLVTGVAVTAQGNVYASDTVTGIITKVDTEGTRSNFASGFVNPVGLLAHPTEEVLYVVTASEPGEVFELQQNGTVRKLATNLPRGANDLIRTEDGTIYTAHYNTGNFIYRINTDGSVEHFIDMPISRSIGIGYMAYHNGFIYFSDMMSHAIHKTDLLGNVSLVAGTTGGTQDGPVATAQLWAPVGLTISTTGDTLYVSSYDRDEIRRITGLTSTSTSIAASPLPITLTLDANYPNPFWATTRLSYTLAQPSPTRITIFDAAGREQTAWHYALQPAGSHEITVDTKGWASGVYYYRLQTDSAQQTRSMLLVK